MLVRIAVLAACALAFGACGDDDATRPKTNQWLQTSLADTTIHVLLGSGPSLFAGSIGAVFRSTNLGAEWTSASIGPPAGAVLAIESDSSSVFAGTWAGVFRSEDNGVTWNQAGLIDTQVTALLVNGSELFAGTSFGVFRSSDQGSIWSPSSTGLSNLNVSSMVASGPNLIVGTRNPTSAIDGKVFYSTDQGGSWNEAAGIALMPADLMSNDGEVYAATFGGVYRSSTDGVTWAITGHLTNNTSYALAANASSIFVSTDAGVFRSNDRGAQWTSFNTGLVTTVSTLGFVNNELFAGTYGQGVWHRPAQ